MGKMTKTDKEIATIARIPMSESLFVDIANHLNVPLFRKEGDFSRDMTFGDDNFGMTFQTFYDAETAEDAFLLFYEEVRCTYFIRNPVWFVGHGYKAFSCQTNDMVIHYVSLVRNTILSGWALPESFLNLLDGIKGLGYA